MPKYLNHNATLQCTHGGQVIMMPPPMRSMWVMESPVVTDVDLYSAFIVGCPQMGPGFTPCINIVSILMGLAIQIEVDGETPILASLQALTDGCPPGFVSALDDGGSNADPAPFSIAAATMSLASRIGAALIPSCIGSPSGADANPAAQPGSALAAASGATPAGTSAAPQLALDKNQQFAPAINAAAARTGLPSASIAAMIDAEADKKKGVWDPNSKATGSSAVGLTQFLDDTWEEMATKPGTKLNETALAKGYIKKKGSGYEVVDDKEDDLLKLRTDPDLSVTTGAEYGKENLDYLDKQGLVPKNASDDDKAKLMYLAHHEGKGGAKKFLNDDIGDARAEKLLKANVGAKKADELTTDDDAEDAYHKWLNGYVDQKIQPGKFRAAPTAPAADAPTAPVGQP